jgi:hypothetical protein
MLACYRTVVYLQDGYDWAFERENHAKKQIRSCRSAGRSLDDSVSRHKGRHKSFLRSLGYSSTAPFVDKSGPIGPWRLWARPSGRLRYRFRDGAPDGLARCHANGGAGSCPFGALLCNQAWVLRGPHRFLNGVGNLVVGDGPADPFLARLSHHRFSNARGDFTQPR